MEQFGILWFGMYPQKVIIKEECYFEFVWIQYFPSIKKMIYNNKPISYKEDTRTTEILLKISLETIWE